MPSFHQDASNAIEPRTFWSNRRLFWIDSDDSPTFKPWLLPRLFPAARIFFAFQAMIRWVGSLGTARLPAVNVSLCRRHRFAYRFQTAVAYFAFPAGLCVLRAPVDIQIHLWAPVLGFFVSTILWSRPRPVKAVHVGIGYVTLAGVGAAYLELIEPPAVAALGPSIDTIASAAQTLRERLAASRGARPPSP